MGKYKWSTVSKDKKRVVVKNDKGKEKTLLTPTGKCAKFKAELDNGIRIGQRFLFSKNAFSSVFVVFVFFNKSK